MYRYTQNGLLHMLDRNRRIKESPQRFQLNTLKFDVIITCEERVYDQCVECKLEYHFTNKIKPVKALK